MGLHVELVDRIREQFVVRQFQCGNADAFISLIKRYERRLLYYLRRFERDPERAIDVLQEVWLTAWNARTSLRDPSAFRAWIYRITHGKIVGTIRAEMRRRVTEHEKQCQVSIDSSAPDTALASVELVHAALRQLTAEHREVLTLRFLEEMSIAEIAEVTRLPPGTVKSRLHYASKEILSVIEERENVKR